MYSRIHRKLPKAKNFASEECKQTQNHWSPVKLESKTQAKTFKAER